ncbi:cyclic nucleotide-binding domain-containing protein [Thermodesulfobacteriota bacterium]
MPLREMIDEIPMFERFSEEEKTMLAGMDHSLLEFTKDDMIIKEGDDSTSLYMLIKGTSLITKTTDDANIRLSKLNPGEIFGEMSAFSKKPRQSNVVANDDVLVLKMDDDFFQKVNPDIKDKIKDYLIELLIDRLDNMNDAIMRISRLMRG